MTENRRLAPRPALPTDVASWSRYPGEFERHFADYFGFRDLLLRWNAIATVHWLGTSPNFQLGARGTPEPGSAGLRRDPRRVVKGSGSWFYYFGSNALDDHLGLAPFSQLELEQWRSSLEDRRRRLARLGIRYLFVLVPDKHTVYPQFLPSTIGRGGVTRADQLIAYLRSNSDRHNLEVLDLRGVLIEASARELTFDRTGTHWNDRGAYLAYREIILRLAESFPGLAPHELSRFEVQTETGEAMLLLGLLSIRDLYTEERVKFISRQPRIARLTSGGEYGPGSQLVKQTPNAGLPSAMVIHDSFVRVGLEPFLSEHFHRTFYHWTRELDPQFASDRGVAVVIDERVERALLEPPTPLGSPH